MPERRMFSNRIANSAKFLQMPSESQLLYFHLCLRADDDGIVESYPIIRLLGSNPDVFKVLIVRGFIQQLNEDQVIVINDWLEHNQIRADRKVDSIYKHLLPLDFKTIDAKPRSDVVDNSRRLAGPSTDSLGKDRLGKVSIDNTATELPIWLNKESWEQWVQYRKERNKKLTPTTIKLQLALLEKHKGAHMTIINESIRNGWTGLFAPKPNFNGKQRFDNKREDEGNIEFNENYRKIQEMKKGIIKGF